VREGGPASQPPFATYRRLLGRRRRCRHTRSIRANRKRVYARTRTVRRAVLMPTSIALRESCRAAGEGLRLAIPPSVVKRLAA